MFGYPPLKPVFNGELYQIFVSFSIRVNNHVEYRIKHNLLIIESKDVQLGGRVTKETIYRLDYNVLVLFMGIEYR